MDENEIVASDANEDTTDTQEEEVDWKAKHAEEVARRTRAEAKLEKQKINQKVEQKVEKVLETQGLDRLDKAILRAEKITSPEEIEIVERVKKETGKTVEEVIESKYFLAELKEFRELQTTKENTPSGSKRSGQAPRDTVEYWIAKGELPPANDHALRVKVVNAKMHVATSTKMFSDDPVA